MVFSPSSYLGRWILGLIALLYILLLVLNLVSFGGLSWITYTDYNVQFGLWRVCYGVASASRTCRSWTERDDVVDSASNTVIFSGKPGFIQSAQGLEIVSIIFYIVAGILLILGYVDRPGMSLEHMFIAATVLLFLSIIFLSSSLGLMSAQGRSGHSGAYLDWAWWIGMLGLIVTIICVLVLIIFIVDAYRTGSPKMNNDNNNNNFAPNLNYPQQWDSVPTMTVGGLAYPPPSYFPYPSYNQGPPTYPPPSFYPTNQFQTPFMGFGGMNEPQPSPALAALLRQQLTADPMRRF